MYNGTSDSIAPWGGIIHNEDQRQGRGHGVGRPVDRLGSNVSRRSGVPGGYGPRVLMCVKSRYEIVRGRLHVYPNPGCLNFFLPTVFQPDPYLRSSTQDPRRLVLPPPSPVPSSNLLVAKREQAR